MGEVSYTDGCFSYRRIYYDDRTDGRTDGMAKDVVHMWNKWEIEKTNKIHRSERTNFKWMVGWMDGVMAQQVSAGRR